MELAFATCLVPSLQLVQQMGLGDYPGDMANLIILAMGSLVVQIYLLSTLERKALLAKEIN